MLRQLVAVLTTGCRFTGSIVASSRLILVVAIIASSRSALAQQTDTVSQAQSLNAQKSAMSDVLTQQVCPSNLAEYSLIDVKQACWWSLPTIVNPPDVIECENAKQDTNEVISAYNLFVMRCRYHVPSTGAYSPSTQAQLRTVADRWQGMSMPAFPPGSPFDKFFHDYLERNRRR